MADFSRQGYTGGPVNMAGRLNSGAPATVRSEATEYERAQREIAQNPPLSMLGALIHPQASLMDAIRAEILRRQQQTGYSPEQPPGVGFGSLIPGGGQ